MPIAAKMFKIRDNFCVTIIQVGISIAVILEPTSMQASNFILILSMLMSFKWIKGFNREAWKKISLDSVAKQHYISLISSSKVSFLHY